MRIKSFTSYANAYSRNPQDFEHKVAIASPIVEGLSMFKVVSTPNEAFEVTKDIPIVLWNNFSFSDDQVNENFCSVIYNQTKIPNQRDMLDRFSEESFVPKSISDRSLVKKMKFPITGLNQTGKTDFKTYGKFKKSEERFDRFYEKPTPTSKFEVLVNGKDPIHLHKKINKIPFDVDLKTFKHRDVLESMCDKINEEFKPEFYSINLLEANGQLFLDSISRNSNLTPAQAVKMYESAYEKHYDSSLPNWFKWSLFENHVKPYYKRRYYDSLLLKPTGVIDYQKYLD